MNNYEQKRQNRINRLEAAANLASQQAESTHNRARQMASVIPFGQPILVGHHSEKRDRNYRGKISRTFEKSFELQSKAQALKAKAQAAASNRSISSDDPEAVIKLKEKLAKLESIQTKMKAFNAALRKDDLAAMQALGFSDEQIAKLKTPDFAGRIGFPPYSISNNNQEINRLKKRIDNLTKQNQDVTTEKEINGVRIVDNVDDNRLQIFFPGKPAEEVRAELKSHGFIFSKSAGNAWQRKRSNMAAYWAEEIARKHYGANQDV